MFTVRLLHVVESTAVLPDFGDDTIMATAGVRHTSTFAFWTWNAGVTQAPQGQRSPTATSSSFTFNHIHQTNLTFNSGEITQLRSRVTSTTSISPPSLLSPFPPQSGPIWQPDNYPRSNVRSLLVGYKVKRHAAYISFSKSEPKKNLLVAKNYRDLRLNCHISLIRCRIPPRRFQSRPSTTGYVCDRGHDMRGCWSGVIAKLGQLSFRQLHTYLTQVVHTHVPLLPSSIGISQRAVMSRGWEGNRRSVVALDMLHRL